MNGRGSQWTCGAGLGSVTLSEREEERGGAGVGGEEGEKNSLVAVRVMGANAGCCQERLTGNTGIIVGMGVIFFPQCIRALSGRMLEGVKVLTGLCRNTRH